MNITAPTLVEVVRERARDRGADIWLRYLVTGDIDGERVELSYRALEQRAIAIAAELQRHAQPGERALLLFLSGVEFITALCGCLFAGLIPVPAYPPDLAKPERSLAKLYGIASDCEATVALTTADLVPMLERLAPAGMRCIATDACQDKTWTPPALAADTIALLQYTSGSTGSPKGVVLRHHHLIANEASIAAGMGPVETVVGWLPIFHDMGLIGNVLQTLCAGSPLVLMSPIAFLKRPARWLEAISHFRATTSGGPNFAYDLCVRRITEAERARLDLASWQVAYCGAEPIREATYRRFADRFAPTGFSSTAFYPCYGLAEATLFVTGKRRAEAPRSVGFRVDALDRGEVGVAEQGVPARVLTSCGVPSPGDELRIVDPETALPVAGIGEIWVRGPGVASGYWRRPSDPTFGARLADGSGPFLRTGDLGFLYEGELFIAGRRKDLIILAGRNLFPQDLEAAIEAAVPAVRKGCCAAFSIDQGGDEKLCIMAEHEGSAEDVVREIKRAVAEHCQAAVFDVVLVGRGEVPKTSSGKLERHACRRRYRSQP